MKNTGRPKNADGLTLHNLTPLKTSEKGFWERTKEPRESSFHSHPRQRKSMGHRIRRYLDPLSLPRSARSFFAVQQVRILHSSIIIIFECNSVHVFSMLERRAQGPYYRAIEANFWNCRCRYRRWRVMSTTWIIVHLTEVEEESTDKHGIKTAKNKIACYPPSRNRRQCEPKLTWGWRCLRNQDPGCSKNSASVYICVKRNNAHDGEPWEDLQGV